MVAQENSDIQGWQIGNTLMSVPRLLPRCHCLVGDLETFLSFVCICCCSILTSAFNFSNQVFFSSLFWGVLKKNNMHTTPPCPNMHTTPVPNPALPFLVPNPTLPLPGSYINYCTIFNILLPYHYNVFFLFVLPRFQHLIADFVVGLQIH